MTTDAHLSSISRTPHDLLYLFLVTRSFKLRSDIRSLDWNISQQSQLDSLVGWLIISYMPRRVTRKKKLRVNPTFQNRFWVQTGPSEACQLQKLAKYESSFQQYGGRDFLLVHNLFLWDFVLQDILTFYWITLKQHVMWVLIIRKCRFIKK